MKLKSLFLAALLFCGAMTATAQKGTGRFGITGGMNVTNMTELEQDTRVGFHLGLKGEYFFTKGLYGSAGLQFTQKGFRTNDEIAGVDVTFKATPGYLQLPLAVGYRHSLGNGCAIFGETGPYFAVGVSGKMKLDIDGNIADEEEYDLKFFDEDEGDANRFDAGWGLRAGVEFNSFQVALGYEHGFCEVWDKSDAKNWNFNVGLTYFF